MRRPPEHTVPKAQLWAAIETLHGIGLASTTIARLLGYDAETIRQYTRDMNLTKPPAGAFHRWACDHLPPSITRVIEPIREKSDDYRDSLARPRFKKVAADTSLRHALTRGDSCALNSSEAAS